MLNEVLRRLFGVTIERHKKSDAKQVVNVSGISAIFEKDAERLAADRLFEADAKGRMAPRKRRPALDNNRRELGGF
jgi:hypothetical protein